MAERGELPEQSWQAIRSHIENGRIADALSGLSILQSSCGSDLRDLGQLTNYYSQLGRHREAYDCASRAVSASGENIAARLALVSAATSVGRLEEAATLLDKIIVEHPEEAEAHYTRSTLKRHRANDNHIDELKLLLSGQAQGSEAEVPLCYALGKELEEIGEFDAAFAHIERGANARRSRLRYDVHSDTDAMRSIGEVFDRVWWDNTKSGDIGTGPIFVLGLPRSGTTLVDRILASHPDVASLGEINDAAYAVIRLGSPAVSKYELMRNAASADMSTLGKEYWLAARGYGETQPMLIDKTPSNFLYLGLVAKALPEARIIHIHRHPMASGYALYKSLFRMGCPYSYDLNMIAQYWCAYRKLMDHWQELIGSRILDVSYEELVDDQEKVSRRIVAHCRLEWTDQCLRFHENTSPTATASASQVREPLYRSARDLWRNYENYLEPLRIELAACGARVDRW